MMIESLPEEAQDRVVEHLREYIEDLRDEMRWMLRLRKRKPAWSRLPNALDERLLKEKLCRWTMSSYEVGNIAIFLADLPRTR